MTLERTDIANFYDDYKAKQRKIGVNIRHRTILHYVKQCGLKKNSNILEIGCGIGTVTRLLASYANKGKTVAVDISPESIQEAKAQSQNNSNIEYKVSDMSDFSSIYKFDFVVLPDVLEHIPVSQHKSLFATIRRHMHQDSTIFIHIPNPWYLRWVHKNKPELLQIIDQPLSSDELLANIYPNDLYLHSLQSYSLATEQCDYQAIVLKPNKDYTQVFSKPKTTLLYQEFISRFY